MDELEKKNKFEALKYRHEDQSKLLQFISSSDNQIYAGFLSLQLAFGSFLTQIKIASCYSKIGLSSVDLVIGVVCCMLLYNNFRRRKEVVKTINNCNLALGFSVQGVYLPHSAIDSKTTFRPWFIWFRVGLLATVIGIVIIIFNTKGKEISTPTIQVHLTIASDTSLPKGNKVIVQY